MSEEAGAGGTGASAHGAASEAPPDCALPAVETAAEGEAVAAEEPAAAAATATAAPQQREADKTAAELVAAEETRAQAGGLMGDRLPEGWVDLSLNERLMEHPDIEIALGDGKTTAEPNNVKGNFLLFDKGLIPQSQVSLYSAFVRTPAEYNHIHELEKIVKPMMNVKVGKEHGVFCAVVDDPGKGVLIGLVYFHERSKPLLATDVAITKISWADDDYELPDHELVDGMHPALLAAANAMDEWVEEVPLTRKEKEARAQARAQAAKTAAEVAAEAEAAEAAATKALAKAAEERAAEEKAAAEFAARNAPTDPGPLTSWDAVEKMKKTAVINALKFHRVKFGEHENRPQLVIKLCAKLKIKKEPARVEAKKARKREGRHGGSSGASSGGGSSGGKSVDGGNVDDNDDDFDDDAEIAFEKARIDKANKRLKVLAELRKQADELERGAAAAGPTAVPTPSGACNAIMPGATGVSPGKAITNGNMPYRDLARGATHIYERGAFDGATVNISAGNDQLSAMMGGGSAFSRQSRRPEYGTPSPMLPVSSSSSSASSMGPYGGHTHDAHAVHHGQQQQNQWQWPQQPPVPQQPPPPGPDPDGTCVVSGPDPDRDLDAIEAWEARVYAHDRDLMSDTSSGSGPDRNDYYYRDL